MKTHTITLKRICVFCGSSSGVHPGYVSAAQTLGSFLGREQIGLVYGGAKIGLMGAVADAALAAGAEVIGIIPKHLMSKEVAHQGISELRIVDSMHTRKAQMADLSDGFIAMPGGYGTIEEFCEVLTWSQLGLHQKPVGLLNVRNYYSPLLELFNRAVEEQFVRDQHRALILHSDQVVPLIETMRQYQPLALPKWLKSNAET